MAIPCVEIVTVCDERLTDTAIEPENPPPVTLRFRPLELTLPEAEPDALNVRSSHSPDARAPLMRSF